MSETVVYVYRMLNRMACNKVSFVNISTTKKDNTVDGRQLMANVHVAFRPGELIISDFYHGCLKAKVEYIISDFYYGRLKAN
jgi:hypothetical protein